MFDTYLIVKTLHILSATILFGTGIGIAFFMMRSYFSDSNHEKLYAARGTVIADYIFTFPAAFLQPMTGAWLVHKSGYDWMSFWLTSTYALYFVAGLCWVPVVWIQIQLKNMLVQSVEDGTELPQRFYKLSKIWFMLGWPAFISLVVIFYLMVAKPV